LGWAAGGLSWPGYIVPAADHCAETTPGSGGGGGGDGGGGGGGSGGEDSGACSRSAGGSNYAEGHCAGADIPEAGRTRSHRQNDPVDGSSGPGGPVLVERLVRRVFDHHGRCWQRVAYHRPLTPAEYDARCAADAAAGRSASLRRALGDERGGADLLADLPADKRATLARLRSSRRGQAALGELAAEVRRRFASRLEAARAAADACPETAAWVARLAERPWPLFVQASGTCPGAASGSPVTDCRLLAADLSGTFWADSDSAELDSERAVGFGLDGDHVGSQRRSDAQHCRPV
jgi:hypothetical protein